jgi:cellobiose phosphorylase
MYRLITESLLGLHLEVDCLRIEPVMPADWETFELHYRYRDTFHHIRVRRVGPGNVVTHVMLDGVGQANMRIPLSDDRQEHHAEVQIGGAETED